MIERTRLSSLTGVIAVMALLIGGATMAPARAADEDPNLARLMAPCYQALRAEEGVRPKVYVNSRRLAEAHQEILNGLQTNSHCSSTLSPMASMHLATDAFLWSLLAQDEQLLGNPNWHHSLDVADGLLSRCVASPDLTKQGISTRCQNQRSFNIGFAREPYANDPCRRALTDEQNASDQLASPDIDQTRTQAAFNDANEGLAQIDRCQSPPMRLVTRAYLLSLRAEAEHDLNIPGSDRTFEEANDLLTQCSTLQRLPNDVAQNCRTQRTANETLVKEYHEPAGSQTGTITPESYTPVPWTYPLTAGFSPANLKPPNDVFAATVGYDTYAAIGNRKDLSAMFDFGAAGPPANYDDKAFFKSNMPVVRDLAAR